MLHVDLPTQAELRALLKSRDEASVSLFIRTTPLSEEADKGRIRLGNLLKEAEAQLEAAGTAKRSIWPISEQVQDLMDDDDFWRFQANSLAVFVTPDRLTHWRLPTTIEADIVQVSDRFHLKPLLRAVSVPQHAYVLALEENRVHLFEVTSDQPAREVRVPDMPKDAASAVGTASVNSRSASGRIQGGEGQKLRLRQYCRKVDAALRPVLSGRDVPLILAAADPLQSLYRSVSSYDALVPLAIAESPATISEPDLTTRAREVLDRLHEERLAAFRDLFEARRGEGRATTDLADAARAVTFGAVDTLLVDIDKVIPGEIDEANGAVTLADAQDGTTYGIVDEIARRTILNGGTVLGVRSADIPDGADLAAILRYAV